MDHTKIDDLFRKDEIKLIFEHKFLVPASENVRWLKNFLQQDKFKRLWIKSFNLDKDYTQILTNQKIRGCDVRVLVDDTSNWFNHGNTPMKNLLKKLKVDFDEYNLKYFPIKPGTLHNKYVIFEIKKKIEEKIVIRNGIIAGSFNLATTSESKTNDLIIYYIEYPNDLELPGMPHTFEYQNEQIIQQNLRKAIYDFTVDWVNDDLKCPMCGSQDYGHPIYCHTMSMKEGGVHLLSDGSRGIYQACDECANFCEDSDKELNPDLILFQMENEDPTCIYICSDCDSLFTENGGLIGEDMVLFFSTTKKVEGNKWILRISEESLFTF